MSQFRPSVTREIKSRLSFIEVVRRYVDLRRAGNRWMAPCPFHQETKPSFSVNEEEGFFYCFGCQAAGDLFDFYGRINGLDFKETLAQLAEEAGVSLKESRPDPRARAEQDLKKVAVAMYSAANEFYRVNLTKPVAAACREYLERRQLDQAIIEEFELGWSLAEWSGLRDALRSKGYTPNQGVAVGLLTRGEKGSTYDRFRGRLMFPIKSLSGQVIAFGGRIIGDEDAAKYINSTDTPLYKKGDNLYGLYQARRGIAVQKSAILTEGYMDVLTLHQYGYTNACGVLGTAMTPEQVRRLSGFCSRLELIFDGDAPGRKAALKACEIIVPRGLSCSVVLLPDKEDIDSLLHKEGREAFEDLRAFAPDGLDYCIRSLAATFAPKEALDWVREFVAQVDAPELLSDFISRLTRGLDLDERQVRQIVVERFPKQTGNVREAMPQSGASTLLKGSADREIMKFVVRFPHHVSALRDAGVELVFTQPWATRFWQKVAGCGPEYEAGEILRLLDDKEKEFWGRHRVMEAPPPDTEREELKDMCAMIARLCIQMQGKACLTAMRQTGPKGDFDMDLLKALQQTLDQKRTSGSTDE